MSDIRKLLDIISESSAGASTAGAIASTPHGIGEVQKRNEDGLDESTPESPKIIEYGNWENSALTTSDKLKKERKKASKVVKSIYGEDVQSEAANPKKQAAIAIAKKKEVAEGKFTVNAKTGAKLDPRTGAELPAKEKPLTMKDMFSQPKSTAPKLTLDNVAEMDNRTPAGDRREQIANSPEAIAQREKQLQAKLKKVSPKLRKKLRLPDPKEGVAEEVEQMGEGYDGASNMGGGLIIQDNSETGTARLTHPKHEPLTLRYKGGKFKHPDGRIISGSLYGSIAKKYRKYGKSLGGDVEGVAEGIGKGEYGRVLDALQLYYPRFSMEELNVPGYHKVIANKANVPVEYAAQVINDFVKASQPNDDDDWLPKDVAEGQLEEMDRRGFLRGAGAAAIAGVAGNAMAQTPNKKSAKLRGVNLPVYSQEELVKILKNGGTHLLEFIDKTKPILITADDNIKYYLYLIGRDIKGALVPAQNMTEHTLEESDLILNPASLSKLSRGLISQEHDRTDHEVEMAKSDLYQAGKNAVRVYELIKDLSEEQGLEGWVQEKIIKAADYLNTVREYLEGKEIGETKMYWDADRPAEPWNTIDKIVGDKSMPESADGVGQGVHMFLEGISQEDLADVLCNRLERRHPDIYKRYDYDTVYKAVDDVASFHAGAEELGSSDISLMIGEILKNLENSLMNEGKPGLWANIHAKRDRIKSGSGERMRKPGSKGAPSAQDFKDAAKTSKK